MDRNKKIIKMSILGVFINILLVIFKAIIGFLANSISVIVDAVNNLTDVLSSVITIVGTKFSTKAPDKEHPYGHGRIEYFTAAIISAVVFFAGISAGKESILKIIKPVNTDYSIISLIVISGAVIIKFIFGTYLKKEGKKINAQMIIATGQDALMDSLLSLTILVSAIINYIWHIGLEGYLGLFISLVIIKAAIDMLKEAVDSIIGVRVDKEIAIKLKNKILFFKEIQGVYDLNLHDYGPSKIIASAHIQVRNDMTAEEIHILTREIEYVIFEEFGIILTMGIYAANDKGEFSEIKNEIENLVKENKSILQFHGFYVDKVKKNIYFDLIIDFDEKNKEKIKEELVKNLKEKYKEYNFNIILDSDITD